jgi:putative NADH-flavin reductase
MMEIVVLGAGGRLGREIVAVLVKREQKVCAVVRRSPDPLFDSAVEVRLADAQSNQQIQSAISGFDAVVNVIGGGSLRRNNVASSATAVVVPAVETAGIKRYIAMSAGMVALDWPLFKYVLRPLIFRHILAEHNRVEAIVRASPLDWTIVRPTALTNHPAKGYVASLELQRGVFITTRADVAAFIADELAAPQYIRQAVFIRSRRTT